VYVETLVLRDTLEDRMLKRRKQMSNLELQQAEKSLLDDSTMSSMIKQETFIPFRTDEMEIGGRVARLKNPQPLFGRGLAPQGTTNPEEGLVMAAGDVPLASGRRKGPVQRAEPVPSASGQAPSLKRQKHISFASDVNDESVGSVVTSSSCSADPRKEPRTTGSRMKVSFLVND
jgi:hypothetical protein